MKTRDQAIHIFRNHHRIHRQVAEAWIDSFVDLGLLALEPTEAEKAAIPRVAPPGDPKERAWHWVRVPVPAPEGSRFACIEWLGNVWYVNGSQVTPEQAASFQWEYVEPALEPGAVKVPVTPYGVHEGQGATADLPAEAIKECKPPNLPLGRSSHRLRTAKGEDVRAIWTDDGMWLFPPVGIRLSPIDAAQCGFEYLAAEPERLT